MERITFDIEDRYAKAIASAKGWKPTIDDTSKEIEGDEYPQIPNPVSYQVFLSVLIPEFIHDFVMREGQQALVAEFTSIADRIIEQVKGGYFNAEIIAGDREAIINSVKREL